VRHEIGLPGAMALGKKITRESALRLEAFSAPVAALENPGDCFFSLREEKLRTWPYS